MPIELDPLVIQAVVAALVVAGTAWTILYFKRRSDPSAPYDTIDKVLWGLTVPVVAVVAVAGMIGLASANSSERPRREGDDDLSPDEEPTDPPTESRGDQVARIIEERAEEVEDHVLNTATDDEVAARGAALFDPGASVITDEPKVEIGDD